MQPSRLLLLTCLFATPAFARLGDTQSQAIDRYGMPKQTEPPKYGQPLLEGAKELTFEYQGWKIRCSLLLATDGVTYVVREEYTKLLKPGVSFQITDYERQAILEGEGGAAAWSGKPVGELSANPVKLMQNQLTHAFAGQTWTRADGAVAVLALGGAPFRFDLPQAFKHEQAVKAAKEQKAKAAVPKF